MRTDAEVAAAAQRTAEITLKLVHAQRTIVNLHRLLSQARGIAVALEADNAELNDALTHVLTHYLGPICPNPQTCGCPVARLTRLLDQP